MEKMKYEMKGAKDRTKAIVYCCGPSVKKVDHETIANYPGMVIAVNWAVKIGHLIKADYYFGQKGAWILTPEDAPCIVSGDCIPVIGIHKGAGKDYLKTLPEFLTGPHMAYHLNGKLDTGGFQLERGKLPGYNAGFSAINLALHLGAKKIALLGFDCTHALDVFDRKYKPSENDTRPKKAWRQWANELAGKQAKEYWNAEIINGSMISHCEVWPKMEPNDAIEWSLN